MLWRAGAITVVIMDGLGHGPEAAQAAANGLRELAVPAGADDPLALLGRLDRRLAGGRGAVAAVARMSSDEFSFSGIGNIGARLGSNGASAGQGSRPDWACRAARPAGAHGLVSSMGTLGLGQRLRPQAFVAPWREHSLFTAHTDGVRSSWDLSRYPGLTGHDPAVMAALIWRDAATRGDDAAVVVTVAATRPAANSEPATSEPATRRARRRVLARRGGPVMSELRDRTFARWLVTDRDGAARACAGLAQTLTQLSASAADRGRTVATLWAQLRDRPVAMVSFRITDPDTTHRTGLLAVDDEIVAQVELPTEAPGGPARTVRCRSPSRPCSTSWPVRTPR